MGLLEARKSPGADGSLRSDILHVYVFTCTFFLSYEEVRTFGCASNTKVTCPGLRLCLCLGWSKVLLPTGSI